MIELSHVSKSFPGAAAPAVGDLSLHVPEGEAVVLVGPSGCGKTTTLKMINRLIEPTSGTITVGGRSIVDLEPHQLRREIGHVTHDDQRPRRPRRHAGPRRPAGMSEP